jgi:hypothetical protein
MSSAGLVDKSLIVHERVGRRWRLLDTVPGSARSQERTEEPGGDEAVTSCSISTPVAVSDQMIVISGPR